MTKTETKWTPGPWRINDLRHQQKGQIQIRGDWHLANVLATGPRPDADARLIAAAPDLVEAVKALLAEHAEMNGILLRVGKGFPVDGAHPDCARQIALAALSRAGVTP